jgi:hypothetical protein
MGADISIWQKPGHFYFALTRGEIEERLGAIRKVPGAPVERCTDGYDDSKIQRYAASR